MDFTFETRDAAGNVGSPRLAIYFPQQRIAHDTTAFPWWIIVVVVAILLLVLAFVFIQRRKKQEEEEERKLQEKEAKMEKERQITEGVKNLQKKPPSVRPSVGPSIGNAFLFKLQKLSEKVLESLKKPRYGSLTANNH